MNKIGCYTFKGVLQFKGLVEIWPYQEICHTLRTCGNHPLIPRVCKQEQERDCDVTHRHTLSYTQGEANIHNTPAHRHG